MMIIRLSADIVAAEIRADAEIFVRLYITVVLVAYVVRAAAEAGSVM
jgi:hypothetical protein